MCNLIHHIIHIGVYFSLKEVVYANNSVIPITEIGETTDLVNTGLQCITDRRPCCRSLSNRGGEWYFPYRITAVPILDGATSFYRNRGDDGTVNLNRLNTSVIMPTGQFCCVVPDATGVNQTICAYIGIIYACCNELHAGPTPSFSVLYGSFSLCNIEKLGIGPGDNATNTDNLCHIW